MDAFTCQNNHYVQQQLGETEMQQDCTECGSPAIVIPQKDQQLSHSFVNDLDRCERYAYFRRFLHLHPKKEYTIAINAGSLWHIAMRAWHSTKGSKDTRIDAAKSAVLSNIDQYPDFPYFPNDEKGYSDVRSVDHLFHTLDLYVKHYGEFDDFSVTELEGVRTNEIKSHTLIEVEKKQIIHTSVIDQIGIMKDGQYCVVDFKSTRMLTQGSLAAHRMSHQFTGYLYAVRELTGIPVTRVIVDIIGWFKHVDPIKHFVRVFTTRTPQQIEDWKHQMVRRWERWEHLKSTEEWDQKTSSCGMWNQQCPYMGPCASWKGEMMHAMLRSDYKVKMDQKEETEED